LVRGVGPIAEFAESVGLCFTDGAENFLSCVRAGRCCDTSERWLYYPHVSLLIVLGCASQFRKLRAKYMGISYGVRKRSIRVTVSAVDVSTGPNGEKFFTPEAGRRMYPEIFDMPRPRPVTMIWRGWYFHVAFLAIATYGTVELADSIRSSPDAPLRIDSSEWAGVLALLLFFFCGYRLARSWFRDRELLANGDPTVGIVIDESVWWLRGFEWFIFLRFRPRSVRFRYQDASGNSYVGRGMDHAGDNFKDAPILVCFDRHDPKRSVGSGCSIHQIKTVY
jgi:hypothetical protein